MKAIFTLLLASAFLFAGAQCSTLGASVCSGAFVAQNFNSSNGNFTSSGLTYDGTKFQASISTGNGVASTVSMTSPTYTVTSSTNFLTSGFLIDYNKENITSVSLQILNASNAILYQCAYSSAIIAGNVLCMNINTTGLTAGTIIKYRYVINLTNSTGSTGTISFDNFSLGGNGNITLPVSFTSIEGFKKGTGVRLNWSVGFETNVSGYDIERSAGDNQFQKIAFVPATGSNSYTVEDLQPIQGQSFYRIKSVDIDGKFQYSQVITINDVVVSSVLKAFPLPVRNTITLQHATANNSRISLNSSDGRSLKMIVPVNGSNQTAIDVSDLRPGLYFVRYTDANGTTQTIKIIKE